MNDYILVDFHIMYADYAFLRAKLYHLGEDYVHSPGFEYTNLGWPPSNRTIKVTGKIKPEVASMLALKGGFLSESMKLPDMDQQL